MILTETWLNSSVPDSFLELAGRYMLRADRTADDSGKTRGGGLSIYVNKAWCTDTSIIESHCSPDLEYLMVKSRPFYLPREFTSTVVTAAYIPPDANAKLAMKELHAAISKQQTLHPEAAFIVAGDFNHSNLKTVLPKFHQHVSCPTRGAKTLDHVYTNMADAYKAVPLPHLGQSDHLSLFLLPKYSPLIKRVKPQVRIVKVWPEGADLALQQRFEHTDWSVFATQATLDSHTDIDTYASSVLDYINTSINSVTTSKRITTFPNQKPWMNREVRLLLRARDAAFRSGDALAYRSSRADLKRGIKEAKHSYKLRIEEHFKDNSDPRRMWQGIQAITDYKSTNTSPTSSDASFPDELNSFYARFERDNQEPAIKAVLTTEHHPLILSPTDVYAALSKVNARKAAGPDGIPGRVLRACAGQLAEVLTDIFNLSLDQAAVPTCFKTTSIVPVPKHSKAESLNDFRPVALTPTIMKCLERLVLAHLKTLLPPTLDPLQFAYRQNRSTEDAISMALHSALSHLDNNNTYVRMLFIDFSSAFNTIIPSKLITKLSDLGINASLCNWILDFLTNRPQSVRLGNHTSSTLTLNTGVPQGCVLSPLLYSLFTYDCTPVHGSNSIVKFADDTTVIGLIRNNDESAYREEVQHLAEWCADNNLALNIKKTKELIVDFRKRSDTPAPLLINETEVERVTSFKFLGVHISEDLSWSLNTSTLVKKAHQRLFFLRRLKKAHLSPQILVNFYRCTIESILTNCISVWYGSCSIADQKSLQRVVKTAQRITGSPLPSIEAVQSKRCLRKARSIVRDSSHPSHRLFSLLPSGKRYRVLRSRTSRFRKSFFPAAVTLLNSQPRCPPPTHTTQRL
uniref:Reverse transcriptase domain-containing protein n=1 Tax=Seriola dumerili TaxID=41447 RepID=A0A3B4TE14_SERDU